jgi:dihydrofolate reductase
MTFLPGDRLSRRRFRQRRFQVTKVVFDISMSLDGFVTAANTRPDEPMGDGGERLHEWAFGGDERSSELLAEAGRETGAVVCGRNTYDHSVPWWGADGPTGQARLPVIVVTHSEPDEQPENGVYTFATGGIEAALKRAEEAAGGKTVAVMGGADLGRQVIRSGLVDEISIHLVPVLFGSGMRLFDEGEHEHIQLEAIGVEPTPSATHMRFRVVK